MGETLAFFFFRFLVAFSTFWSPVNSLLGFILGAFSSLWQPKSPKGTHMSQSITFMLILGAFGVILGSILEHFWDTFRWFGVYGCIFCWFLKVPLVSLFFDCFVLLFWVIWMTPGPSFSMPLSRRLLVSQEHPIHTKSQLWAHFGTLSGTFFLSLERFGSPGATILMTLTVPYLGLILWISRGGSRIHRTAKVEGDYSVWGP